MYEEYIEVKKVKGAVDDCGPPVGAENLEALLDNFEDRF